MTNKQIQKKYRIEPIMKEMWVWDEDKEKARIKLVLYRSTDKKYPYEMIDIEGNQECFANASETNPNEKEPKVGDNGYFWDDESAYLYATLINIEQSTPKYDTDGYGIFKHFSHEKKPWMK